MEQKGVNERWNGIQYTADSIESHEGLEQIRVRPTVYIGRVNQEGLFRLFCEPVANVLDEFNAGRCNEMHVVIDTSKHYYSVEDEAFGMPIERFEDLLTRMSTGGKFGKSTYTYSIGLNSLGLKCVNALSSYFEVDTYFNGKHGHFVSHKGIKDEKEFYIEDAPNHKTGTIVRWIPDDSIFETLEEPKERIMSSLEMDSYKNNGISIDVTWDGKKSVFYHPEGMKGYFIDRLVKKKHYHTVTGEPIVVSNSTEIKDPKLAKSIKMAYTIYATWAENCSGEYVESYVNGLRTINNGTHVTGAHMAITKAVKDYINKAGLMPKNAKYTIEGNDIRDTMVLLVDINHSAPLYTTQIKDAIDNSDIQTFLASSLYTVLQTWLGNNKREADAIGRLVMRSGKARQAAKDAKENVVKATKASFGTINMKKFAGCETNDPDKKELFIVEGDSAAGSAKKARNTEYQCIFAIRGKSQNIFKSKDTNLSDEFVTLVNVMECGIGPTFNINKLAMHTIVFGADADDDGAAIRMLLMGFYFKYYPIMIERGYIYEARPPLFQLKFGRGNNEKIMFLPDQQSFDTAVSYIAVQALDLQTIHGIKLSSELSEAYIRNLLGFSEFVDKMAKANNCSGELLEFIVRYYQNIKAKNFKNLELLGYEVSIVYSDSNTLHINVYKGYEHYFLVLDDKFYENTYIPISKRLSQIKLMDLQFVGKRTGTIYGGSCYRNSQFVNSLLINRDVEVTRIKGLGESEAEALRYYMFNPKTRTIVRVRMNDKERAIRTFDVCLGKSKTDIENRKLLCTYGNVEPIDGPDWKSKPRIDLSINDVV